MQEQCPPWAPPSASRAGTEGRAVETAGKAHRLSWRNPAAQSHGTKVSAWHSARGCYVRRAAIGKLWETAGRKGWTFPAEYPRKLRGAAVSLWDGSPPAGYFASEQFAKKGI